MVIIDRVTLRDELHFSQLKYLLIPKGPCPLIQMPLPRVSEPQMPPQRHEVLRASPKSFQELRFPGSSGSCRGALQFLCLADPHFLSVFRLCLQALCQLILPTSYQILQK